MEEYRRWEDNIKMDLKEIGVDVRSWIDSAQDRDYWRALVNAVLNLRGICQLLPNKSPITRYSVISIGGTGILVAIATGDEITFTSAAGIH